MSDSARQTAAAGPAPVAFRLIDHVRDALLLLDREQRVVDCNLAAARALERPRQAMIGQPITALLPREITALLQSPVHLRSEVATTIAGTARWLEVDVTPIDPPYGDGTRLIVARDISERQLTREALMDSRRALEAANARLLEQSITDPLTGLRNRRFLFQRLEEEVARHRRRDQVLALLLLDIDHFKSVNDTHGHPAGDAALIEVARTLAQSVRESDVVGRIGGEEFAVIAVDTHLAGLGALAERLRAAVAARPVAASTSRPMILTISIGIAVAGADSDATRLFAAADRCLYRAKGAGRNRVEIDVQAPDSSAAQRS